MYKKIGIARKTCAQYDNQTYMCKGLSIRDCQNCNFYKPNLHISERTRHVMDLEYFMTLKRKRKERQKNEL